MKKIHITLICITIICIGLLWYVHNLKSSIHILENNLRVATTELQISQLKIDSTTYYITSVEGELVNMRQELKAEKELKIKYKSLYLKSIESITTLKGTVEILKDSLKALPDSVFITIYEKDTTYQAIKLPYEWSYTDQYFSLITGIKVTQEPYFKINMKLDGEVLIGETKLGPKGAFITTNPYITINSLNVKVSDKKVKWYDKKWIYGLGGFTVGMIVNSKLK